MEMTKSSNEIIAHAVKTGWRMDPCVFSKKIDDKCVIMYSKWGQIQAVMYPFH